jgi:hypothetical protein
VAVEHRHAHGSVTQGLGSAEPAEPAADDHDVWHWRYVSGWWLVETTNHEPLPI